MTLPGRARINIWKSAISPTEYDCPARDRLPMFLIFNNSWTLEFVEGVGKFRRRIPNKEDAAAFVFLRIP